MLKTEAKLSTELLATACKTAQRHSRDHNLHLNSHKDLKSLIVNL